MYRGAGVSPATLLKLMVNLGKRKLPMRSGIAGGLEFTTVPCSSKWALSAHLHREQRVMRENEERPVVQTAKDQL